MSAAEVLAFWFGEPAATPEALARKFDRWYEADPAFDAELAARFGGLVERALGEDAAAFDAWAATPEGAVALVILLDQLPRNLYRGDGRAFAGAARAERVATAVLDAGLDAALGHEHRQFLLMPLLHAEDVGLQRRAVVELERLAAEAPAPFRPIYGRGAEQARKYLDVITRFGRFPHRNAALGRESTPEERDFLQGWAAQAKPTKA